MPWQGAGLILGQLLLCNGWDFGWTPTVISQQHTLYISLICYYYILLYSGPSQLPYTLLTTMSASASHSKYNKTIKSWVCAWVANLS